MLRSIGAVAAGFMAWSVLWLGGNVLAGAIWPSAFDDAGLTTDRGILATILAYSVVLSLVSGWLSARAAGRSAVKHAVITGVLLLIVGVLVQISVWEQMPLWYHIPFLAAIVPANLMGARLGAGKPRPIVAAVSPA